MKVWGQLENAQLENKATDYSAGVTGRFWLNTISLLPKFDTGAAIKTLVTEDGTQKLDNKNFDSFLFNHISTPATPASGKISVYGKSNNKLYMLKSNGVETEIGTGSGATGINHISNGSFEDDATGYSTYADAAGVAVVDGTGGSPTSTFAVTTSSPLRGAKSGLFTKDAANRQGEGFSYDFTIEQGDLYKINLISFDYETSTNYVDGDMRCYIVNTTSGEVKELAVRDIAANSYGTYNCFFQADGTTAYRLVWHVSSTSALAYTLKIDNVKVGPQTVVRGALVTDWQSYTPTFAGFGTVSSISFKYRQVGDSYEVKGTFEAGTPTATAASITLPGGASIDSNKMSSWPNEILGQYNTTNAGASGIWTNGVGGVVGWQSSDSTKIFFGYQNTSDASSTVSSMGVAGSTIVNAGANVFVSFRVPVSGKSANVILSEDVGGRQIAFRAHKTSSQAIPSAAATLITFDTNLFDTVGAHSNGTFTVPESGVYTFNVLVTSNSLTAGEDYDVVLYKNGTTVLHTVRTEVTNTDSTSAVIAYTGQFTKGDAVTVACDSSADTAYNVYGDASGFRTVFSGFKNSSPQTIAGVETVAATYTTNAGQAVNNAAVIIYEDKSFDTHNAMNTSTGEYTVPVTGKYKVLWTAVTQGVSASVGNVYITRLYKNGSVVANGAYDYCQNTSSRNYSSPGSAVLALVKGDVIKVDINEDIPAVNMNTTGYLNQFSIVREG